MLLGLKVAPYSRYGPTLGSDGQQNPVNALVVVEVIIRVTGAILWNNTKYVEGTEG